jgi:ApaG protein
MSLLVLQYLEMRDLLQVMPTSRAFWRCATQDLIWSDICGIFFPYARVGRDFYAYFCGNKEAFLGLAQSLCGLLSYLEDYSNNSRMSSSFARTANPLARQIYPKLACSSEDYLSSISLSPSEDVSLASISKAIIRAFEGNWSCEMPMELYYFYLLFNGQETSHFAPSILGSYKFNNHFVNPVFLPLVCDREHSPHWFQIANCPYSQLQILVDVTDVLGKGKGAVCFSTNIHNTVLYVADSLASLFSHTLRKLQAGVLELTEFTLNAFERNEWSSLAVTEGIAIHARSQFVPHQSDFNQYLWAYEITISPQNPIKRWRLASRKWEIGDVSGFRHTVEGSGVVGLHPEVYPGSEPITYESCCLLQAPDGWMQGSFQFVNMDNPSETLSAQVDRFSLKLPAGAELVQVPRHRTSSNSS